MLGKALSNLAKDTKQRILSAALARFNEWGYFNVRLQHIADAANMSVGNMAYHFKHKMELFNTLFDAWQKQQYALLAEIHLTPIFNNFDTFLEQTYQLQQQYLFLYADQLELIRMSVEVKAGYHEYYQNQQDQLDILLTLYQARGVVDWKETKTDFVALKIRRIIDNWWIQQLAEGATTASLTEFQGYIWLEIAPYLTPTGRTEFEERKTKTSILTRE